jgi:enoyl-CoA hydratase/carnithine racemase
MPSNDLPVAYGTLTVREEGRVLFAGIRTPPTNLLGPDLVRDLVSLIERAEADPRSRCSCSRARTPITSSRTST